MKPFLAALAVSISFAGESQPSVTPHEGEDKSNVVKVRVMQQEKASERTVSPRSAGTRVVVASIESPGVAVALQSESDWPKLAPPRTHWPLIGRVQTASLVALALADYDSTQRGLARGGREVGLVLSCGGQLCEGRYAAINAGVVLGTYVITRYAIPRLPQRWRRATNIMLSGMIGGRGFIVVRNYQRGNRLVDQGR